MEQSLQKRNVVVPLRVLGPVELSAVETQTLSPLYLQAHGTVAPFFRCSLGTERT